MVFNNIYICGVSAKLIGLSEFIGEQLNVNVSLLNPLEKFQDLSNIDNPYQYGVALGLALRGVEQHN